MVGDDLVGPGVDGSPVGHVEVLRGHLHAVPLAPRHRLGQPGVVDVGQRQVRAAAGEFVGQRTTDARARAGDGGHTAVEDPHVRKPPGRPAAPGVPGHRSGGGAPERPRTP